MLFLVFFFKKVPPKNQNQSASKNLFLTHGYFVITGYEKNEELHVTSPPPSLQTGNSNSNSNRIPAHLRAEMERMEKEKQNSSHQHHRPHQHHHRHHHYHHHRHSHSHNHNQFNNHNHVHMHVHDHGDNHNHVNIAAAAGEGGQIDHPHMHDTHDHRCLKGASGRDMGEGHQFQHIYKSAPVGGGGTDKNRRRTIKKAQPRPASGRRLSYHTVSKCSSDEVSVFNFEEHCDLF